MAHEWPGMEKGKFLVQCWCGRKNVRVDAPMLRAGLTLSCGSNDCNETNQLTTEYQSTKKKVDQ